MSPSPSPLKITLAKPPAFKTLLASLITLGYTRNPLVMEPGDFSVRGSVVDIFPARQSHPLRLEYDTENQLDRFTSFYAHSQRSISNITETTIHPMLAPTETIDGIVFTPDTLDDSLLSQIAPEDFVVHEHYGIGQFKGLVRLTLRSQEGEFLYIQYRGTDKLYVPLDQLHLIHRYASADIHPPLNGLTDGTWQKTTRKIKKELLVLAQDLVLLYKKRALAPGFAFAEDTVTQLDFEAKFPHVLTPDQHKSLTEIKTDMESTRPMDRVLCGDVGYGKTELMLRAAFKACDSLKQVAILVPTTLLAYQHHHLLMERFKNFPYRVASLSRFNSKKEQQQIVKDLKDHKIDVVVGTHRLLQSDVQFADLGLLIVDEEQRFGVTHKEKMKQLTLGVDVLSVSATPIPRTLYMALTGAREFSTIQTPPLQKRPITTHILPFENTLIAQAITFEHTRGGQVFYVYNQVQKMPQKMAALKRLLPELKFAMAHGQMSEHALETTMLDFWNKKFDVLICSTIIENGIDNLGVNTIIIEDADHFGLSQIHQLRGRVGRGKTQGIAYLLFQSVEALSELGQRRLQAIKEYAALGAGYKLAMRDLEIRGAGTLLGQRQHGHMTAVGFELYCQLLNDALTTQKGPAAAKKSALQVSPDRQIFIPDSYIEDPRQRLAIYQRLASIRYRYELEDLQAELEDRFGSLPAIILSFFRLIWEKLT